MLIALHELFHFIVEKNINLTGWSHGSLIKDMLEMLQPRVQSLTQERKEKRGRKEGGREGRREGRKKDKRKTEKETAGYIIDKVLHYRHIFI
jgi:hypothetical protein